MLGHELAWPVMISAELVAVRMPEARAEILARLWGALAREPLPGITGRRAERNRLTVTFTGGTEVRGPADAAQLFARPAAGLLLHCGGTGYADPGTLVRALPLGPHAARFATELDDSVANLALARAGQPAPDGGAPYLSRCPGLAGVEQCVVDGHPVHPLCRTRLGMSPAEVVRYAPEHRPVVALAVIEVPAARWLCTGAALPPRLPVHPWQVEHVLDRYPWLVDTGRRIPARPLMSLRTLAPRHAPRWHLKTSLDVQMTSAVRLVSPAAVRNGPPVSGLLARLGARYGVEVLREVAAGAVLVDGQPCASLAVVRRRAPVLRPGEVALPLAALAAPSPASGRPLVVEAAGPRPAGWFAALVQVLLPPLLRLLHAGVALEAHGQNTLVVLRDGRPVRLLYRDVGGVRLHPGRLRRAGVDPPHLHGALRTDDPGELLTKLSAAVLSTVVGELVALLCREYGTDPGALWRIVAATVRATYARLGRRTGDAAALFGPRLPAKALTAMRLSTEPLDDVWAWLPNPMAGLR
jgi:siderophore synthetase component